MTGPIASAVYPEVHQTHDVSTGEVVTIRIEKPHFAVTIHPADFAEYFPESAGEESAEQAVAL